MLNIINEHNYDLSTFSVDSNRILFSAMKIASHQAEKKSLSVKFCNEQEITEINKKYRKLEKKTDVLSFPFDVDFVSDYFGDIVICYPFAKEQSIKYGHSLKRELSFLFLHGILHLFGYDHLNEDEEKIMFALQENILSELGITREKND